MDRGDIRAVLNLSAIGGLSSVTESSNRLMHSVIMFLRFLVSPLDDGANLSSSLIYILDIFYDFDQVSEGEMQILHGKECFINTYMAPQGLPVLTASDGGLAPDPQRSTESQDIIMPTTRTGLTRTAVDLFSALVDRESLRRLFYVITDLMVKYGPDFTEAPFRNTLSYDAIFNDAQAGTPNADIRIDCVLDTPEKVYQVSCLNLLRVIIAPLLAVSKYRLTAQPVTDFQLFYTYDGSKECLFPRITDIKDNNGKDGALEPRMMPGVFMTNSDGKKLREYKECFDFNPHQYTDAKYKDTTLPCVGIDKTFGYNILVLIEKSVDILATQDIDVSHGVTIGIIEFLMEFPAMLNEYAALYGWLQDPSAYNSVYTSLCKQYCRTVTHTAQTLLDLSFMSVFFRPITHSNEHDLDVDDTQEEQLAVLNFMNRIATSVDKDDPSVFHVFLSNMADNVATYNDFVKGFLSTLGITSVTDATSLCDNLLLGIQEACNAGSARAPVNMLHQSHQYMQPDAVSLLLTGLEYVVFLLQALSYSMVSDDMRDPEQYRDVYAFLDHDGLLKIIMQAFALQTNSEKFLPLLQQLLDESTDAISKTRADHLGATICTYMHSVAKTLDRLYMKRTGSHVPVTDEPMENVARNTGNVAENDLDDFIVGAAYGNSMESSGDGGAILQFSAAPSSASAGSNNNTAEAKNDKDVDLSVEMMEKKKIEISMDKPAEAVLTLATSASTTMLLDVFKSKIDFMQEIVREFVQKNSDAAERLWSSTDYTRQITLFYGKYETMRKLLQDIYVSAAQLHNGMASAIRKMVPRPYPPAMARAQIVQQGYIGGIYGMPVEQMLVQLVRNSLMVPSVRASMRRAEICLVKDRMLYLRVAQAEGGTGADTDVQLVSATITSAQDLLGVEGMGSVERYGVAAFFRTDEESLVLDTVHAAFYLTDTLAVVPLTGEAFEYASSHRQKMRVYLCSPEAAASSTVYGGFEPDHGHPTMVCNGRSYGDFEDCRFCRVQQAFMHGRYKGQSYLIHALQMLAPMADCHDAVFARIQEQEDTDSFYALRDRLIGALTHGSRDVRPLLKRGGTLFIPSESSDKSGRPVFPIVVTRLAGPERSVEKLNAVEIQLHKDAHVGSLFIDKRYVRIQLSGTGPSSIRSVAKLVVPCLLDAVFGTDGSISAEDILNRRPEWVETLASKMSGRAHKGTDLRSSNRGALWVLADSPQLFASRCTDLVYEIYTCARQHTGFDLGDVAALFDGIGTQDFFLAKALQAVIRATDPAFGAKLVGKVNEKMVAIDINNGTQSSTTRLMKGMETLMNAIYSSEEEEYRECKPSQLTRDLVSKAVGDLGCMKPLLRPLVAEVMAHIPIKFMSVGQFNALGCPASLSDGFFIVRSRDCNIDDTRRFITRTMQVVELVLQ